MRLRKWSQSERGGALKVILLILAGLLLLVVIAAVVGVQMLRQYVHLDIGKGEDGKVAVSTPVGDFSVEKAEDAARRLRLPLYPGVTATEDAVSVRFRADVDGKEGGFTLTTAKFYSTDSFDKIDAWYGQQLGSQFTRQQGKVIDHDPGESGDKWVTLKVEPGGNDVVYKEEHKDHVRVVALEHKGGQVDITLLELHPVEGQ